MWQELTNLLLLKKTDLVNLIDVDELDIDKMKVLPTNLSNL